MENTDQELKERQKALLNQARVLIKQLEGDAKDINWKIIAKLAEAIKQTAESAIEIDPSKKYIKK